MTRPSPLAWILAASLGLSLGVAAAPGWSAPDVKPADTKPAPKKPSTGQADKKPAKMPEKPVQSKARVQSKAKAKPEPKAAAAKKPPAAKGQPKKAHGVPLPTSLKPLLGDHDRLLYKEAFAKASDGKWGDVQRLAGQAKEKLPAKLLQALDLASNGDFDSVATFLAANPDWPYQNGLRLRAEDQVAVQPAAVALEWFKRFPPLGTKGQLVLAQAQISAGQVAQANATIRQAWINANYDVAEERAFLDRYRSVLTDQDDIARLDRLLWDAQIPAARRMMTRVDEPYRHLAEARIRLQRQEGGVEQILAKVPPQLQNDPGLIFERLRFRRRQNDYDGARDLLVNLPHDLRRPTEYWTELSYVIRRTLNAGDVSMAYRIAKDHRQDSGASLAEAEFLAGWISLRYLRDTKEPRQHFLTLYNSVRFPVSLARAAYWSGRAAEAAGDHVAAQDWYRRGAKHATTFYGQLSARRAGEDLLAAMPAEPVVTAERAGRFDRSDLARLTRMLAEIGDRDRVKLMFRHLTQIAQDPVDFALVARLATVMDMPDQAVRVARRAEREATPLVTLGYPLVDMRKHADDGLSPALVHALIRQESGFDRDAVSRAGARGLMQLMPDTARLVAKELKVSYQVNHLTEDPSYNVLLGRTYLKSMIDDLGAVPPALAAYNAGPGRARRWMRDNGDPRIDEETMVDWIESIPFDETRSYVQRVMEGEAVYRLRLGGTPVQPPPASRSAFAQPSVPATQQ